MLAVKQEIVKKLGIQSTYTPLLHSREYLLQYEPKSLEDLPPRSMQDSFTSAIIPLSSDKMLQDKYVTFLGHVRLGRLMEDMDLFAGKYPYGCITELFYQRFVFQYTHF